MNVIETKRLILRNWDSQDAENYFQLNRDARVTEFLLGPISMDQVHSFIIDANKQWETLGYSLWAVELKETRVFIGFIGLRYCDWESHFTPAAEVGWRLAYDYWGCGYATEGAIASLDYGFNMCGLSEIVSFTVPDNMRSRRVMQKIGMKRDMNGDFFHPKVSPGHKLSRHVLYRMGKVEFNALYS